MIFLSVNSFIRNCSFAWGLFTTFSQIEQGRKQLAENFSLVFADFVFYVLGIGGINKHGEKFHVKDDHPVLAKECLTLYIAWKHDNTNDAMNFCLLGTAGIVHPVHSRLATSAWIPRTRNRCNSPSVHKKLEPKSVSNMHKICLEMQ